MVAVTKRNFKDPTAVADVSREHEVEEVMLELLKPFTAVSIKGEAQPSTTKAGGDPAHRKDQEQEKDHRQIGFNAPLLRVKCVFA